MSARWRVTKMSDDPVEERREWLERLAERNDLKISEYAEELLEGNK